MPFFCTQKKLQKTIKDNQKKIPCYKGQLSNRFLDKYNGIKYELLIK